MRLFLIIVIVVAFVAIGVMDIYNGQYRVGAVGVLLALVNALILR